jgi:Tfp pilus assembly protein PilX
MRALTHLHYSGRRRTGSALITTLWVLVTVSMLISAVLPLSVASTRLTRGDRDRAAALAAAEAGLNWEVARINTPTWDRNDSGASILDGSGNPAADLWPDPTSVPPSTASTKILLSDSSGQWTHRFIAGTSVNPYSTSSGGSFTVVSEGQVRSPDGKIVKRRVKATGAGLASAFDTVSLMALSSASSAVSLASTCTVNGPCGSNGQISGSSATITSGPIWLCGSNASITGGVNRTGVPLFQPPATFEFETADQAASLLKNGSLTGATVTSWKPTGYDVSGNSLGPFDKYGRAVNNQADIVNAISGAFISHLSAKSFLDSKGWPILDGSKWAFGQKLRLKPGVYYFAKINLGTLDLVEVANDFYKADGVTPLWDSSHNAINGPATSADYDSDANRVTIFVDAAPSSTSPNPYLDSKIGPALYTALWGTQSVSIPLRYRRPGNFRIYAKNAGGFTVNGYTGLPLEFNCNLLHYNYDSTSSSYYGSITLNSSCNLYGSAIGWTVSLNSSSTVNSAVRQLCKGYDPVVVASSNSLTGGFGGWSWQEIAFQ